MNLFWKRLLRTMQSTPKFEQKLETVRTTFDVDEPENRTEEYDLKKMEEIIHSFDFQQKKELFRNKKYKDTDEYRIMRQYEKLLNDIDIKLYYETQKSELLKEYLTFKTNPDALNLKNLSILEISDKIEKLKAFEQSREYKNYTQYNDSLAVREFEELKRKINEPDFQQTNAFWADPNRWESTFEFRMEQRYNELAGNKTESILPTRNKTSLFKKYGKVKLTFHERFDWAVLDESRWSAGFHSDNPRLMGNYSFTNEWQANHAGRNISTSDGILTIHTLNLPAKSLTWDIQKGFTEQNYAYTSDVIQTSATFRQKYGIFSAKVRCSGAVHHALWLSGEKKLPHINLFYFNGKTITMGNANQHVIDGVEITGIPEGQFFIYTLEWTPKALIWYVNNVEVYRTSENIPHQTLYLGVNSFLPKKAEPSTGTLELDWIKVFAVRE